MPGPWEEPKKTDQDHVNCGSFGTYSVFNFLRNMKFRIRNSVLAHLIAVCVCIVRPVYCTYNDFWNALTHDLKNPCDAWNCSDVEITNSDNDENKFERKFVLNLPGDVVCAINSQFWFWLLEVSSKSSVFGTKIIILFSELENLIRWNFLFLCHTLTKQSILFTCRNVVPISELRNAFLSLFYRKIFNVTICDAICA